MHFHTRSRISQLRGWPTGIGIEAAKWLAAKQVALVGADNWGVEVGPNPDAALAFPAYHELLIRNGIFLQENLESAELVADRAWEIPYVFAPVPIKGANGLAGKSSRHPIVQYRRPAEPARTVYARLPLGPLRKTPIG